MPYLQITEDGVVSKLEWAPNPQVKFDRKKMPKVAPVLTLGQEVEEAVRTWYSVRNMPVPPEEIQVCREIDGIEEGEYKKVAASAAVIKPTYGTPEFWKDWWAKKKAKDAAGEPSKASKAPQKPSAPKSAKLTGQA